jgi:hypothetical protein
MNPIFLKNYSQNFVLAEPAVADQIFEDVMNLIKTEKTVEINFEGVKTMTTICGQKIFGRLYVELGGTDYFEKIKLLNHDDHLKIMIRKGIEDSLDEQEAARKKNTERTPAEKIKVHTDECGDKYVQIPVTVYVKIYLPEDLNPVAVTIHDIKSELRHLERIDLGELVLGELDVNKVEKERPIPKGIKK